MVKFVCTHLKIFYPEEQLKVKTRTEKSMELYEKVRDEKRETRLSGLFR